MAIIVGNSGDNNLVGTSGNDQIWAQGGDDTVDGGGGHDTIGGSSGDDLLDGGSGSDDIFGGSGEDTILGGHGHDELYGGSKRDVISGGVGNDTIWGGDGDDILSGGTDALGFDVFAFDKNQEDDIINDFDATWDTLLFVNTSSVTVHEAFSSINGAYVGYQIEGGGNTTVLLLDAAITPDLTMTDIISSIDGASASAGGDVFV